MSNSVVALVGSGVGPFVSTHRLAEPHLVLERAPEGEVKVAYSDHDAVDCFSEAGKHVLRPSKQMRVEYVGNVPLLVCMIGG